MFPLSCKESGRKFAKPQPRRIFRCSGSFDVPDKTVPTTQRYFRHRSSPCAVVFVIDIIVIFPINLVLPAIDSIRVPLELHRKLNSHGIGKKGGRKNVWGEKRGEEVGGTSENPYFSSTGRGIKRRRESAWDGVEKWVTGSMYIFEKASARLLSGQGDEKLLFHPSASPASPFEQCLSTSVVTNDTHCDYY